MNYFQTYAVYQLEQKRRNKKNKTIQNTNQSAVMHVYGIKYKYNQRV